MAPYVTHCHKKSKPLPNNDVTMFEPPPLPPASDDGKFSRLPSYTLVLAAAIQNVTLNPETFIIFNNL